ncbi:hypothetical protein C7M84_025237 [Penaeus vannamei]|uniref:Uncharacterized protein n=1 Tax=Penaeus vannamei TaxID=6689 RepID=A0A3R7PC73_PENVA|nr:hypothetical protein C7M84_025237 [Penaeus vannamei]
MMSSEGEFEELEAQLPGEIPLTRSRLHTLITGGFRGRLRCHPQSRPLPQFSPSFHHLFPPQAHLLYLWLTHLRTLRHLLPHPLHLPLPHFASSFALFITLSFTVLEFSMSVPLIPSNSTHSFAPSPSPSLSPSLSFTSLSPPTSLSFLSTANHPLPHFLIFVSLLPILSPCPSFSISLSHLHFPPHLLSISLTLLHSFSSPPPPPSFSPSPPPPPSIISQRKAAHFPPEPATHIRGGKSVLLFIDVFRTRLVSARVSQTLTRCLSVWLALSSHLSGSVKDPSRSFISLSPLFTTASSIPPFFLNSILTLPSPFSFSLSRFSLSHYYPPLSSFPFPFIHLPLTPLPNPILPSSSVPFPIIVLPSPFSFFMIPFFPLPYPILPFSPLPNPILPPSPLLYPILALPFPSLFHHPFPPSPLFYPLLFPFPFLTRSSIYSPLFPTRSSLPSYPFPYPILALPSLFSLPPSLFPLAPILSSLSPLLPIPSSLFPLFPHRTPLPFSLFPHLFPSSSFIMTMVHYRSLSLLVRLGALDIWL